MSYSTIILYLLIGVIIYMALIKCQVCGKEISDKAERCPDCQNLIEKAVETQATCMECGQQNSLDSSACVNCGCPLKEIKNSAQSKEQEQTILRPRKIGYKILFGALAGGLVFCLALFLLGNQNKMPLEANNMANSSSVQPNLENEDKSVSRVVPINPDFRDVKWGMGCEEVKAIETAQFYAEKENSLYYKTTLIDKNMVLVYDFNENDELCKASYILTDTHSNNNFYLTDYESLKKEMIAKYGTPKEDNDVWFSDLYKNDPQRYGLAVAAGHYARVCKWDVNNTEIALGILGDNFEVSVFLSYDSTKFKIPTDNKGL